MEIKTKFSIGAGLSPEDVDLALSRSLPRIVSVVGARAYTNLSGRLVGVRRGLLRRGLVARIEGFGVNGRAVIGIQGRRGFVGRLLESGVKAHVIRARERLLRFRSGGGFIAKERVQHPGIRPRRWLRTAADESQHDIETIMRTELSSIIRARALAEQHRRRAG
jgi:hypothetical protein